jgi:RHS repeat-associated protein
MPTTDEIVRARVFGEPILPLGGDGSIEDNAALAKAITTWLKSGDPEATRPFEAFLSAYPASVWRASVLANLGTFYERHGYFTRAEQRLTEAWLIAKDATDQRGRAVAEQALSELLDLNMEFGRTARLQELIDQSASRELQGSTSGRLAEAQTAVWGLENHHEQAAPSGPIALDRILSYVRPGEPRHPDIVAFHATHDGASVAQIADLTRGVDFPMEAAYRPSGVGEIPIPSIAHLRPGHFTAIVGEQGGHYILDDPLLGGEVWISKAALNEQASGSFLVPEGEIPAGWRAATTEEKSVRGKCAWVKPLKQPDCTFANGCYPRVGGVCPRRKKRMAQYSFDPITASLILGDSPVGYAPPVGPEVEFEVRYRQAGGTEPTTYTFSNLGSLWFSRVIAYIEDNPSNLQAPASMIGFGGGYLPFSGFSGDRYVREATTRSELVRVSSAPIRYERRLTDGSREVYSLPDGAATSPRRVFLTEYFDPQNQRVLFSYDTQLRLISLTDAIGQVTTVAYEHPDDALKITKVSDPFGRSARFSYDSAMRLESITDVIGIESVMTYGASGIVSQLRTPYGMTQFAYRLAPDQLGHNPYAWVEATDPTGAKEKIEFSWIAPDGLATSDAPETVPVGFLPQNQQITSLASYYWDKRAMALHPDDKTKAHVTQWAKQELWGIGPQMLTEKAPLENRVWYGYSGSPAVGWVGASRMPSTVARVLDDGTSQIHRFEWTDKNMLQRHTDPLGRETVFDYGGGGSDLLTVKQRNGFVYELLAELAHNGIHLPLIVKDASAQQTVLTYSTVGQPLTATNAKNETTTLVYDASGYLQTVTGPVAGATVTLTWDAFGRVRTVNYDGRTLTFSYDVLDRVIRVDYPDGTYEAVSYKLLDPESSRDRLGRVTRLFHDALQRITSVQDPQGRIVRQNWCDCGSMDKLIDANGNETSWVRDLQGRVTSLVRANGTSSSVTYESTTSRVKKVTDAKLQDVLYEYFLDGSLRRVSFANAANPPAPVTFTYDPAYPRVLSKTDGQGDTSYGYNPVTVPSTLGAGQLASIDGPLSNDTITLGYDELGRVVSRAINNVAESVAIDTLGRPQTVTNPLGTFNYSYVGTTQRLETLSYPNGQTTELSYFGANDDHRLQQILHKKPGGALLSRHAYTYEPSGTIKTWTQETDVSAAKVYHFEHDRADQLTAATLKTTDPTPSIVKRYVYAYDAAGNRTSEQIDNSVLSSSHNILNQITTTQPGGMLRVGGSTNESADVTVGGELARALPGNKFEGEVPVALGTTSVPVVARDGMGNGRTYTYNVSISGSTKTLTYDANGNVVSDGTRTYEWDAANQLRRVADGETELAIFTYDGNGRRVQKVAGGTVHTYVYDETDHIVEERRSTTGTTRYYRSLATDGWLAKQTSGTVTYFAQDHIGSVVAETNSAGEAALRRSYDPWGRVGTTSGDNSGPAFTGREWDSETGLFYFRARYYDPDSGRFLSADPVGFAGGANQYSYVGNDPLGWRDPYGLMRLPNGPGGLPPGWVPDPSHKAPTGPRFKGPGGDKLDWHPGTPGEPGWGGKDHWHWIPPGAKKDPEKHRVPGDEIPDIEPVKMVPVNVPQEPVMSPGYDPDEVCGDCTKDLIWGPALVGGYIVYKLSEVYICAPLVLVTP